MANKTIDQLTAKANPVDADLLVIADSADNNEMKQITIGSITADIGDGLIVDGSSSLTTTYSSTKINTDNSAQDAVTATKVAKAGDTMTGQLKLAKGADIASATTTDLGAATGNYVDVTGTTTITGLGTVAAGTTVTVRFTGILTLTYNATSLILPTGASITTAAGDIATFTSLGSGNWRCVSYTRATGYALLGGTIGQNMAEIYSASSTGNDTYVVTLSPTPTSYTTGMVINFKPDTANTGACTINVNSLGAKNIKNRQGNDPDTGEVVAGINTVVYDGTNFVLMNLLPVTYKSFTATGNTTGTTTISHGLGKSPRRVRVSCVMVNSAAVYNMSEGQYDTLSQKCKYNSVNNGAGTLNHGVDASNAIAGSTPSTTGTITVDATNITITWAGTSVAFSLFCEANT